MLSKKQLAKASEPKTMYSCESCDKLQREKKEISQTALALLKMLERHVWQKRVSDGKLFCIECRNLKENGHTKNCELAAMLKEG